MKLVVSFTALHRLRADCPVAVKVCEMEVLSVVLYLACAFTFVIGESDHGNYAVTLTEDDFTEAVDKKPHFVMFFAPWCGHCKRLAPIWDELAKKYNEELQMTELVIAKVDCTQNVPLCSANNVKGYPTLLFFHKASKLGFKFTGQRTMEVFDTFISTVLGKETAKKEQEEEKPVEEKPQEDQPKEAEEAMVVVDLGVDTFEDHIKSGSHLIKFFAPWCGHCKRMAPAWEQLAETFKDTKDVSIARVDCVKHGEVCSKFSVRGYPTVLWFSGGEKKANYAGGRGHDDLKEYVEKMMKETEELQRSTEEKIPESVQEKVAESKEDKPEEAEAVVDLGVDTFEDHIKSGSHFIKFFAPWCGHCKRMAPAWEQLAETFKDTKDVSIARVDCVKHGEVCSKFSVRGYPTVLWFSGGEKKANYAGGRGYEDLKEYVEKMMKETEEQQASTEEKIPESVEEKEDKPEEAEAVVDLGVDTFEDHIKSGSHFIKFFAPWCGHCKRMAPAWEQLAETFKDTKDVSIARVDCVKHGEVCSKFSVRGYPTVLWFSGGEKKANYAGGRGYDDLKEYVEKMMKETEEQQGSTEEKIPESVEEKVAESKVTTMTDETFAEDIRTGYTFIEFYAPWCGFCKKLAPVWEDLGNKFSDSANVKIAKIDCTIYKDTCAKYQVRGYPTLILFRNAEKVKEYTEERDLETLAKFVTQQTQQENAEDRDEL